MNRFMLAAVVFACASASFAQLPVRPKTPAITHRDWIEIPLDTFFLHRLEVSGKEPPPRLPREAELQRLTQSLVGRNATSAELAAFVKSRDKRAYEKEIDRLLNAPEFEPRFVAVKKLLRKDDPASARRAANECWRIIVGELLVANEGTGPHDALEWLACEVIDPTLVNCCELDRIPEAWDVKHLARAIVVSAAYRCRAR